MFKSKQAFGNVKKNLNNGKTFIRGLTQQGFKVVDKFREILNPAIDQAQGYADSKYVDKVRGLLAAGEALHPSIAKLGLTDKFDQGNTYAHTGLDYARQGMGRLDQGMNTQQVKDVRRMVGAGYRPQPKGPAMVQLPRIPRGVHGASYGYSVAPNY